MVLSARRLPYVASGMALVIGGIVYVTVFSGSSCGCSTPSYAPQPASYYVSPSGSDSNTGTQAQPFLTMNHAYSQASAGQTIALLSGSYAAQTLTGTKSGDAGCNGNAGGTTTGCITFQQAPDATVSIASVSEQANYVRLDGLTITGGVQVSVPGCEAPTGPWPQGPTDVLLKNITAEEFFINGSNNVVVWGGSYGPVYMDDPGQLSTCGTLGAGNTGTHILIHGAALHDAIWNTGTGAPHMECLHVLGTPGVIVEDNSFVDCAIFDILFSDESFQQGLLGTNNVHDELVQNNLFDTSRGENSATTGGSSDVGWSPTANTIVRFNSFVGGMADEASGIKDTQGFSSTATGGTFTLSWNGTPTAPIAYNAAGADVLSALQAISAPAASVSGGPLPAKITVTFSGNPNGTGPAIILVGDSSSLTGGTLSAVSYTMPDYSYNTFAYGNTFASGIASYACSLWANAQWTWSYTSSSTTGVACGTGSVMYDNPFVDATPGSENWHLASCSVAAAGLVPTSISGGYPTTDIAGTSRPITPGNHLDAGAYEDCN